MNKAITLVLTEQELNVIYSALASVLNMPWHITNPVIRTLQLQSAQAEEKKAEAEVHVLNTEPNKRAKE